jgi:hypothetical protein
MDEYYMVVAKSEVATPAVNLVPAKIDHAEVMVVYIGRF